MPLFDFKCGSCNKVKRNVFTKLGEKKVLKCPQCHENMKRLFPMANVHLWPKNGIFVEHASAKGETFYSRKEAKEFADKHNLEMGILD